MEKRDVRVQLVFTQSEIDALDAYRAKHHLWSRSDAIRRMVAAAIKADPDDAPGAREPRR